MVELRPKWCVPDELIHELLQPGAWIDDAGRQIADLTGDEWKPGSSVTIRRAINPALSQLEIRQRLSLSPDATVGIAARWSCKETALAGSHFNGPIPIPIADGEPIDLVLQIPGDIGGSIEVETCVIVRIDSGNVDSSGVPDGALIWSDSWSTPLAERRVLLEGSELRIPVRTVSFDSYYADGSQALWAIEAEQLALDDVVSASVVVLINADRVNTVTDEFGNTDTPDVASLSSTSRAGILVDMVRVLTANLLEELDEIGDWSDQDDGTVGQLVALNLTKAFGSVQLGVNCFREDQATFARGLWSQLAPERWDSE
jgi:hypothetical protein